MKFTRRNFVKIGGLAALAGIALPHSIFGQNPTGDILANQTAESFRGLLGTEFYVLNENVSAPAVLTKVQDFPFQAKNGECFSLTFEVRAKRIEQATYSVFHPEIGNFELFMTEGKNGKRATLIAVINRI